MPFAREAALFLVAFLAGSVNAVAGGGSLLTFPSLLAAGLSPLDANGTSTVALVPGSASAFWGYRSYLRGTGPLLWAMALPSLVGGVAGALLALRAGNEGFGRLVPALVLGATVLFAASEPLGRLTRPTAKPASEDAPTQWTPARLLFLGCFQCGVALYGGFFGAGIGILMLAALGLYGERQMHRMNGLKNLSAVFINGVAAPTFVWSGHVQWRLALVMMAGAVAGGTFGARGARWLGPERVRSLVTALGFTIAAVTAWKQWAR